MNKYDYVIFDLDGTLINTLEGITVAINHTMKELNLPFRYKEDEVQKKEPDETIDMAK